MLNPATKILFILIFSIVIFLVDKISIYVSLIFIMVLLRLFFKMHFPRKGHIKNIFVLAGFVVLIQALFGPGNEYIISSGFGDFLKWDGLFLGLLISCRFILLMLVFSILTETMPPNQLASGLYKLGFNYSIAFIITAAFNQILRFAEEARLIINAQRMRGLCVFDKSQRRKPFNILVRIKAYGGICLPLVLNSMRKAQSASVAMDSRAFGVYKTRTWLELPKMKARDYLFLFCCTIVVVLLLLFNYAGCLF